MQLVVIFQPSMTHVHIAPESSNIERRLQLGLQQRSSVTVEIDRIFSGIFLANTLAIARTKKTGTYMIYILLTNFHF